MGGYHLWSCTRDEERTTVFLTFLLGTFLTISAGSQLFLFPFQNLPGVFANNKKYMDDCCAKLMQFNTFISITVWVLKQLLNSRGFPKQIKYHTVPTINKH
jgi:hypothetical protein